MAVSAGRGNGLDRPGGLSHRCLLGLLVAVLLIGLAGCAERPEPPREAADPAPAPATVKILHFYAGSGVVAKGEPVTVCYGVENARSVRLEPAGEELTPLRNRCLQVKPTQDTTYKLIATGHDGSTVSESFTIRVGAARTVEPRQGQMIRTFVANAEEISRGQTVTLCYGVENAASVSVKPAVIEIQPAERYCFLVRPPRTTTYRLTATGTDGRQEFAEVTVAVR